MMVEPANREESDAPSARTARVRTAGETSRRGGDAGGSATSRSRSEHGGGRKRRGKPAPVSGRPGASRSAGIARVLAPLALIIFAIASFTVLTSTDDSNGKKASSTEKSSAGKNSESNGGADGGSATVTTKKTYTVKAGDSFAAIAEKLNVDVDTLAELNGDVDPRALQPGQKLKLR